MGFHVSKAALTPSIEEMLSGVMEASNIMDKYAVAVFGEEKTSSGASSPAKFRKIWQTIFYYLKADKNYSCRVSVTGKAVNAGDGLRTKVPCRSFFNEEEKYINILQEKLSVLL